MVKFKNCNFGNKLNKLMPFKFSTITPCTSPNSITSLCVHHRTNLHKPIFSQNDSHRICNWSTSRPLSRAYAQSCTYFSTKDNLRPLFRMLQHGTGHHKHPSNPCHPSR